MILSSLPKVGDYGRAEVAEWQTRRSQKPMRATSCGFDSRSRHQAIRTRAVDVVIGILSLYSSIGLRGRQILSTKRGQPDVSITVVVHGAGLFERVLVSAALVLLVALIYQLIVGGVKIELANGRLTVDPSGLIYWWHIVTGAVTPQK